MSILVSDLNELNLPTEFLELLPESCPSCDSAMQISEALTGLSCTNPHCGGKINERIAAICTKLQIKGFGGSRIAKFIETYNVVNPMDIFDLEPGDSLGEGIGDAVSESVIAQIQDIRQNRKFRLWEAVALCNLPGIQSTAHKLFSEFDDIDEAYNQLREGGMVWVQSRITQRTDHSVVGTASIKAYSTLMFYEDQVKESVGYLNITGNDLPELNLVISDSVGSTPTHQFPTKPVFQSYMVEQYGDSYAFNFGSSVNKNIHALIWSGADGNDPTARYTSKVSKVEGYNAKGSEIPIITGPQLIEFLDSNRPLSELYLFSLEQNTSAVQESLSDTDEIPDDFYGTDSSDLF